MTFCFVTNVKVVDLGAIYTRMLGAINTRMFQNVLTTIFFTSICKSEGKSSLWLTRIISVMALLDTEWLLLDYVQV